MPSNGDARNGKAKKRSRVRLSKLYSYTCARPPQTDENHEQAPIGSTGFSRVVFCNEPERHKVKPFKYRPNYVSTTKYNIITFFPKALFEQFRRVANFYFLVTAILSLTSLSPSSPLSSILPLVIVIGISMIKEAIEDWNRFLQDRSINGRTVKVHVGDGKFVDKEWRHVQVGDVLQVQEGDFFPADLLILSSHYDDGICYVETMNLDGETNLKVKKALEATTNLDGDDKFAHFTATIRCEDPNPELYTFIGNLEYENTVLPIGPQQVLLRDSKLRNTQYIYGVVIFSGHDTKVMQNATDPPSKRSRIERKMDLIIYFLFAVMVAMSLIGGIVLGVRTKEDMPKWWYLRPDDTTSQYNPKNPAASGAYQFITDMILYGYLIPISLYISLEVVKLLQVKFINGDRSMYYEETDKKAHARTSNLNEDLGQVDTILSDKTGTLTCNQMDFLKCSIAGVSYGTGATEIERATAKRLGHSFHDSDDIVEIQNEDDEGEEMVERPHIKGFRFDDERIMDGKWSSQPQASMIQMFFRILAVCHTAIPEEEDNGRTKYEAESPDEAAFVIAAREIGFEFVRRTQTSVFVREVDPTSGSILEREYKVLNLLEFDSTRKRMSVIVQDEDGQIYIFCKGADSVIFERLGRMGQEFEEATKEHLDNYADSGLRTLTLAYRKVDKAAYQEWNEIFLAAKNNLSAEREAKLEEAFDLIENNLILVGATAVEDKLQKGVPECIDKLALAGLKIWVLTGDKMETAINIGFACSLLRQDMEQIIITLDLPNIITSQELKDKDTSKKVYKDRVVNQIAIGLQKVTMDSSSDNVFALIIDGKSLAYALEDDMKEKFLQLAVKCAAVICCRVSPKQKAMVTRLVKKGTGKTTLAIGDGANDVGMIQEADIGVGISGVEGMQAVMASDFSIAQFRFLERLLIVHGHWCYKRISTMICYFFYKNIVFGLTLFFFQAYTNFSGQTLYNDWYSTLFNTIFTALPICVLAIREQDVPAKVCLEFPSIYQQGPKNMFFTWARILGWQLYAVIDSILCFFLTMGILGIPAFRQNGQVAEFEVVGATMYSVIVWVVTCQVALTTSYFTTKLHQYTWGSIAIWYIFLLTYGSISPTTSTTAYKVLIEEVGPAPSYWAANLLVTVACLFPYFVFIVLQRRFWPLDHHILQEIMYLNKHEQDPELWSKEKEKAVERASFGFTARLKSRIKRVRRKHHHRRNPYSAAT